MARKIDTKLAGGLVHLPGTDGPRASAGLPQPAARQDDGPAVRRGVARRLCVQPLSRQQLGLEQEAPLWYYVLREAEILGDGEQLGRVGSTIVAETMLGMLAADPFSFLRTEPTWEPVIPQTTRGELGHRRPAGLRRPGRRLHAAAARGDAAAAGRRAQLVAQA